MISDVCIDANVFVASLTPEPAQDECLVLFEALMARGMDLFAPALVVFEVSSTLHRKIQKGEIKPSRAKEALELFFQLPLLLQWQERLIRKAQDLSFKLHYETSYDCSYLAVAQLRNIPLITLDRELLGKGRQVYPQVFTVSEFYKKFLL